MRGVCHDVSLNYLYLLLKVNSLWEHRYQRQQDQRGFNKLPTVLRNLNFHVMHLPWFLHFGLWAKKLTLKASMCSHIVILYSFNLLVCKPCSWECPTGYKHWFFFKQCQFCTPHHLSAPFGTCFLCFNARVLIVSSRCLPGSPCQQVHLLIINSKHIVTCCNNNSLQDATNATPYFPNAHLFFYLVD